MSSPYAVALSHFAPFGSRTYVHLFDFYGNYESIWQATRDELLALEISEKTVSKFLEWRAQVNPEQLVESLTELGIETIDRNDTRFPVALKNIYDPPIILYFRGQLPSTDQLIGIVGSREPTAYGLKVAQEFSTELTRAGLTVVSGMAQGIDTEAHVGAMAAGGKTIAVLAHGLAKIYGERKLFAQKIIDGGGAIVSEQPPYLEALKFHFPIRNRIIAGLSRGVVIVEAKLPSGTLHTAQAAINAHREVFAIPGPIHSPTSVGPNKLIEEGAHITLSPNDVLLTLGLPAQKPLEPILVPAVDNGPTSPEESTLLSLISLTPVHVDDLARGSGLPTATVLATLTILEIHGKVRHLGNMFYSL
jgi:DNA processing protein